MLDQFILEKIGIHLFPLMVNDFCVLISTGDWYYKTRDALLDVPMESFMPKSDAEITALWEKLAQGLDALAKAMDEEEEGNYRLTKGKVTYAEMELVVMLYVAKRVSPETVWRHVKDRNEGLWEKLLDFYSSWLPLGKH